eukprot:Partr_v1_DN28999_c2_g1_i6_m25734 putative Ferric-chelate reductase
MQLTYLSLAILQGLVSETYGYACSYTLNQATNFVMKYDYISTSITIELSANVDGWLGFGALIPNDSGASMMSGDIIMGSVTSGVPYIYDYWVASGSTSLPTKDTTQDLTGISGSFASPKTTLTFTRALVTGDVKDIAFTPNTPQTFHWAYDAGSYVPSGGALPQNMKHSQSSRGWLTFALSDGCPASSISSSRGVSSSVSISRQNSSVASRQSSSVAPHSSLSVAPLSEAVPTATASAAPSSAQASPTPAMPAISSTITPSDYPIMKQLASNYALYIRTFDNTAEPANPIFEFAMRLTGTGWLAIGFNPTPSGGMDNSDIVMARVQNGVTAVIDRFAATTVDPVTDADSCILEYLGSESASETIIKFRRYALSSDANDVSLDITKPIYLIWAYDPVGDSFVQHGAGFAGSTVIPAIKSTAAPPPALSAELTTMNATFDATYYQTVYELSDQFKLYFKQLSSGDASNPVLEFAMVVTACTGWVGIGFNPSNSGTMQNSDIVAGWVSSTGAVTVKDMYAQSTRTPTEDATSSIIAYNGTESGGTTIIKFRRYAKSSDSQDLSIDVTKEQFLIYAFHPTSDDFVQHPRGSFGSSVIRDFSSSTVTSAPATELALLAHGLGMALSWLILVPLAVVIARYYRSIGHSWFISHWVLNIVAVVITVGLAAVVILKNEQRLYLSPDLPTKIHGIVGLFIMGGAPLQSVPGKLADYFWAPGRVGTPIWPDKLHWWLGRFLVVFGFVNVGIGAFLYDPSFTMFSIFIVIMFFVIVGFVVVGCMRSTGHGDAEKEVM